MVKIFDFRPRALDWIATIIPILFLLTMLGFIVFFTVKLIRFSGNTSTVMKIRNAAVCVLAAAGVFYVLMNFAVNIVTMVKTVKGKKSVLSLEGEEIVSSLQAEKYGDGEYYYYITFSDGEKELVFDEEFSKEETNTLRKAKKIDIYYIVTKDNYCIVQIDADAESVQSSLPQTEDDASNDVSTVRDG